MVKISRAEHRFRCEVKFIILLYFYVSRIDGMQVRLYQLIDEKLVTIFVASTTGVASFITMLVESTKHGPLRL